MMKVVVGSKSAGELKVGDMFDAGAFQRPDLTRGHRRVVKALSLAGGIRCIHTEHVDGGHPREFLFRAYELVDIVGDAI